MAGQAGRRAVLVGGLAPAAQNYLGAAARSACGRACSKRTTQTHTMAKRKSQKDPEDLPDAPDGRIKRKNDDSDSDEVRGLHMPPLPPPPR